MYTPSDRQFMVLFLNKFIIFYGLKYQNKFQILVNQYECSCIINKEKKIK